MRNPLLLLVEAWHRRYATPDAAAIAAVSALRPATIVTGGSEGIGLALAHAFARDGNVLVLVARDEVALQSAAAAIRNSHAAEVATLSLDLTRLDSDATLARFLDGQRLYADVLINNAGIGAAGPFVDDDPVRLATLLDLNVRALTLLTRRFLPAMCARARGGLVNVASLGGYAPGPCQAAYYASKSYVISLTHALAHEVRGRGVRVLVVSPGPVDTRFHARMGADNSHYRWLLPSASSEAVARATLRGYRWGRREVFPALFTGPLALVMRLSPRSVSSPIVGWLLHRRLKGGGDA